MKGAFGTASDGSHYKWAASVFGLKPNISVFDAQSDPYDTGGSRLTFGYRPA